MVQFVPRRLNRIRIHDLIISEIGRMRLSAEKDSFGIEELRSFGRPFFDVIPTGASGTLHAHAKSAKLGPLIVSEVGFDAAISIVIPEGCASSIQSFSYSGPTTRVRKAVAPATLIRVSRSKPLYALTGAYCVPTVAQPSSAREKGGSSILPQGDTGFSNETSP